MQQNSMQQKINFLPYRELQKLDQKLRFKNIMIGIGLAGLVSVFAMGYVFDWKIEQQQKRNDFLKQEIVKLDEQLIEVQRLGEAIRSLEIQRDTVYALQNNRTHAVELMEMFTRRVPEEVYLTDMTQQETMFTIKGVASSNERVSQLMKNLEQVQWIRKVNLLHTKLTKVDETSPSGIKTQRTLYEFSISFERFIEENRNPSVAPVAAPASSTSADPSSSQVQNNKG